MKIYTKTGDKGETSLAMGGRVKKFDPRVELYGTSDELNSVIGIALSFLRDNSQLRESLSNVQNLLFELGSELAGFQKLEVNGSVSPIILESDIHFLETKMDEWTNELESLKHFVLPGGSKQASFLHQARTICRRLERSMVKEREAGLDIPQLSMIFINRLSDFLFVAARYANREENFKEPIWISRAKN
ncbi:cob(I)yrinic acid a,c-diamide adenosyltransferase [Leptospira sp. GIMC2001]|uniref:cob(I)yrinic acid a,c-diamide adenosyltransferase n=1 Tax=Leptospira sp. GIMC2001 TaxID=1513297 RepID=UPI00234AF169|nr:cob(I)yrinic acid a,c-diamide adenosyltransferase [Leptospira sp. GIMC2001]WCL48132.1 cob(I)yrinic acid a,c-diamide adenosyltransferase [Leptospira sp. GIMC2001]